MRYFIELSYDGTRFHGWQIQPNAISVQEVLNEALYKALRIPINVVGCGRTDTGVHSEYYVAHFDLEDPMSLECSFLCFKLNCILPADIAVHSVQAVEDTIHSRFSAYSRTYHYYLNCKKDPFRRFTSLVPAFELDFQRMNEAAELLTGTQDFGSFARTHNDAKTNICTVTEARWLQDDAGEWFFRISANRFLRNMVRAIVGTLFDIGRGKKSKEDLELILKAQSRCAAGSSAAAQGLSLVDIKYPTGRGFERTYYPYSIRQNKNLPMIQSDVREETLNH